MLDVAAMRAALDGDRADVRDAARERLADPQYAPVDELPRDRYRELVLGWACSLATTGSTALGFPVAYGGGGDVGASVTSFEMLGHGDLSLMVKCGVQFGLFGGAILHLGTERHHDAYLRDVIALRLPGCFAMTESGHGSNVQALRTTATFDPASDEFVLQTPDEQARKDYIGNAAAHGRMAVVFAQLVLADGQSRGVHALLAPLRETDGTVVDGVRIEDCGHKLGLNGVDNGRIYFDGLRVPRENLLDRYAQVSADGEYASDIENPDARFFTMVGTLVQGRVSVAGASGSATKNALTIALRHAAHRRQFGPPDDSREVTLLTYATHRRRLLPPLAATYALHFAQRRLVADLHTAFSSADAGIDRRKLESTAAGVKALASWHARDTIQECREACGGLGYLAENRFAALKADTDIFTTFEGDNVVLLQLVGKSLLTAYQHDFGELSAVGTAQFVAAQVFDTVVEKTAVREIFGRLTDDLLPGGEDDLLDRDAQHALIKWRAEHVLQSLARRLKAGIDDGSDAFDVFLETQDHVVTAGRVHIEHLVFDCFRDAVEACVDDATREVLSRLCDLHGLALIERDRGYYQEHGKMSSTRAKDVQRLVTSVCEQLAPDAVALTDAFAIPEQAIAAPIAIRD